MPNKDTELDEILDNLWDNAIRLDIGRAYPEAKKKLDQAKADIEAYATNKTVETLKMILQSAEDQEKASGRRWSRGTFILAITELIDDLEQERGEL